MNEKPTHNILHEQHFESLTHLVNYITDTDSLVPETSRKSKLKNEELTSWTGTDSIETSLELAKFGWGDGLKKIRRLISEVKINFPDLFPRQDNSEEIIHSEIGQYEDPALEDSPDPLSMLKFKPKFDELRYGSILQRLIIETSASAYVDPETMFLRGACIVALVEQLEQYGFRVEVICQATFNADSFGDTDTGNLAIFRTTIKRFEDHLDIDGLAFAVANPSYFRRLIFAVLECMPGVLLQKFGVYPCKGYGYPHNHPIYLDPARDFYMVRPLKNESFETMVKKTVKLIEDRYKGLVEDNYNPDLSKFEGEGGSGFQYTENN